MQTPGVFIVLEGSDGSGKATQFDLLKKRLIDVGYEVEVFDFPRYDQRSSYFVTQYLNGEYGPANSISPYAASLFFALDRYEAGIDIKAALEQGKVVISNRYVGSNMAHQGGKFSDPVDKRSFFVWEDSLEFQLLNIPRPDINIYLRVPAEVSFELIKNKALRNYTNKSHDEHEADIIHLRKAVETYDLLCELFPKDFTAIDCVIDGKLSDIETINSKIWSEISKILPNLVPPPELAPPVETIPDVGNLRPSYNLNSEDKQLIKWRIAQLSLQGAWELTKLGYQVSINYKSSWNGPGSKYNFYTPDGLSKDNVASYTLAYKNASLLHQDIYNKIKSLNRDDLRLAIMRRCIPMGALFACEVTLEKNFLAEAVAKLATQTNIEVSSLEPSLRELLTESLTDSAQSTSSSSDSSTPKPINEILAQLAGGMLPQHSSIEDSLQILSAFPRNEFELLADSVYSFSDLSRDEILFAMDQWTYQQKAKALTQALATNPDLLAIPIYRFDAASDRISLMSLLNQFGNSIKTQQPTVRYGYNVPSELEEVNADDAYLNLYDSYLELFNSLQSAVDDLNLGYATLSGHKTRWQSPLSAQSLLKLARNSSDKILAKESTELIKKINEVHPIVGSFLQQTLNNRRKPNRRSSSKKGNS